MAEKTKAESKEVAAEVAAAPAPFKCPNDSCTKFHKAEFGELVSGAFVVTGTTYRCVMCHTEYETVGGAVAKA